MPISQRILIVDDDIRMCESVACLLTHAKYKTISARSGKQALSLLSEKSFDLAILDVHLPDMLGHEILKHIQSRDADITVIMVTGDADLGSALSALKCGAYDFLRKPFEPDELLNTIANAFVQKALRREKETIDEKLRLSEEKYRYLVQNCPDIIYTLDPDGNFTFISEAVEPLLGFKSDELVGSHYTTIVFEEDQDNAYRFFDERRSRDRSCSGVELRLKSIKHAPGGPRKDKYTTVELRSMGVYERSESDGKKHHIGTHGIIRDISDRKRLQIQLQNAQRMKSIGTLAGGVAHEFNNLLMGIQGRISLMSMGLDDSHPYMEHLKAVTEIIHSANSLTRQLLGFAQGGKYEVTPTHINALVRKTAEMFGRTKKELKIEINLQHDEMIVECDQSQIEQVIVNLLLNAWQAMPNGGTLFLETAAVMLDSQFCRPHQLEPGRYAKISVTDTGIGMESAILKQIFDPFFTTKDKTRGAGLGLASAYGIIKNHAGMISVRSEPGQGTTFDIHLPISEKTVSRPSPSAKNIAMGSETIMLVDDEPSVVKVIQKILERLGYRVIAAQSGLEAVEIAKRRGGEIDLVLLDMIMPGMDGGETFDRIREVQPKMPILLCSGYAIDGQAQQILQRGCNGFIQKPFNLSEISRKIRQLLDACPSDRSMNFP